MKPLRLAIPKGKNKSAIALLNQSKIIHIPAHIDESRKYIIPTEDRAYEFILVKPMDIPVLVEYGVADIGIVSKDLLLERNCDVYKLLDLGTSLGRVAILGKEEAFYNNRTLKVATSYPNLVSTYFKEIGRQADIIRLSGCLELSIVHNMTDCIVELLEEGTAWNRSPLQELGVITKVSDQLIANRASFFLKKSQITAFCDEVSQIN